MHSRSTLLDYTVIVLASVLGTGSVVLLLLRGSTGYLNFGWSEQALLAWDVFLSLFFFLQHSGMVRASFRSHVAAILPPPYHGAVYAIASGIALAIVAVCWQRSGMHVFTAEGMTLWLMRLCTIATIVVFALSFYSLRAITMLGIGPVRAHIHGIDHPGSPFVVRGPYRWVRHPLYSCIIVVLWMNPDVSADRLLFNVLWSAWIYVATTWEERDLLREFGDVYARYRQLVPMFIPWKGPAGREASAAAGRPE